MIDYANLIDLWPIDIAFIDGSHTHDDVRQYFLSTLKHTRKNTYIVLPDTNIYVRELVRQIAVDPSIIPAASTVPIKLVEQAPRGPSALAQAPRKQGP